MEAPLNELQALKQFRHLVRARNWPSSSNPVFASSSVRITVGPDEESLFTIGFPACLIRPGDGTSDPEHDEEPDLYVGSFTARLVAKVAGDTIGELALIGGVRNSGQTDSGGRGLLELEEELFAAAKLLNAIDGVEMQLRAKGDAQAVVDEEHGYVVMRDYLFEIFCTRERFYHPAIRLTASDSGGGAVALAWTLPPARFDRLRVILRRAAGATAPTSPTAGTGVTLSGDLANTVNDTPGVGQWSYALFAAYDETHDTPSEAQRFSEAITVTVTAA